MEIVVEPWKKLIIHEVIEYQFEDWVKQIAFSTRSSGGGIPTMQWTNGIVFSPANFPTTNSTVDEQLKGTPQSGQEYTEPSLTGTFGRLNHQAHLPPEGSWEGENLLMSVPETQMHDIHKQISRDRRKYKKSYVRRSNLYIIFFGVKYNKEPNTIEMINVLYD